MRRLSAWARNQTETTISKVKDTKAGIVLITELMPQWQQLVISLPVKEQFINVVEYVFCDTEQHLKFMCWEIHLVTWSQPTTA